MPYLKSNWSSMPPLEEFGRFNFGEIFTIPNITLTQVPDTKACYLHVALEHESRVQEVSVVCTASSIVINVMQGKSDTSMSYTYVTTMKGTPVEDNPELFSYAIDSSVLSDIKLWQLQFKFLVPRKAVSSLYIKSISVIVEDMGRKREVNMKLESKDAKKSLLNRSAGTQIQQYVPPPRSMDMGLPPAPAFSTENAIVVGLIVVDQVLGVMTKEIQENLESTCRGVEERLLREISVLEEKMNRVEHAYEHVNVDQRLAGIERTLIKARATGVQINYEGDQPTVDYDAPASPTFTRMGASTAAPVVGV